MGKARDLSKETRAQIDILHKQKLSMRNIAAIVGVNPSTVLRTLRRKQEVGNFSSRKRSGRPKKTTPRMDATIRRIVLRSPRVSSSVIRTRLPGDQASKPSAVTIRRRLFQTDLRSYRPAKKPQLSKKNIQDRLFFCRKYESWTPDQWEHVMFSDESTFTQFYSICHNIRRPRNARYNPRYTVPCVKQAPKVMIWGSISGHGGRGGLWVMPKGITINGKVYLGIVKDKVHTFFPIHQSTHFQQDGAPCHKTREVRDWFDSEGIPLLEPWPGNSPDLNIIENIWRIMKCKVAQMNPTSEKHLVECIKKVWVAEISDSLCKSLARSMPDRIKQVLVNKGCHSKY